MFFRNKEIQNKKTEEELISEFRSSGNIEVLGELYSGYMHLVYGVCMKYLRDREEARDTVMQIFEKLIVEIPRHKIDNFRSWLHVVTKNFCLMKLRSEKSASEKYNEWINDSEYFMEYSVQMHPIDEDEPDLENGLADCIERLKGEQRESIKLFYYENRCYNDIAAILKMDEKKVKSHLQNAKRNLKLCLEEKHGKREEI
jgi:RNA polymerase sigma-70 factor, ECF subfamily